MKNFFTLTLCFFTLSLSAQEACPNIFDYDNDGNVAVNDFLAMLGYFGDTDADSDGVWDSEDDCLDLEACNYQANPTEFCIYYLDALGICGGGCQADEDSDGICDFFSCGDLVSHEGYDYSTVLIGEQCWFSENCRYLPEVSPSSEGSESDPYYYVYGYEGTDVEEAKSTDNYAIYGVLYNWPAVMTEGICPSGWHIPSDAEFTQLTDFLGGEGVAGGKMKEAGYDHWNSPNTGATNSSGFTGLPGGYRDTGGFSWNGGIGYWWSSSEYGYTHSIRLLLHYELEGFHQTHYNHFNGFSARCVRD
jgi:uncharacterized protein (TIGR02145 family)